MEGCVRKGEEVMVKCKETELPVVFKVPEFQLQMATRMSPIHLWDKVSQCVQVPTDMGHGGVHQASQPLVVHGDGGRGVVAEPQCVVDVGSTRNKLL